MSRYINVQMKLKDISAEAFELIVKKLHEKNKRTILTKTGDTEKDRVDITTLQNKKDFVNKFIEQNERYYFLVKNGMDFIFHLKKVDNNYKWAKYGEIYFGISINDAYLKYIDDPDEEGYEEMKKERDEDTTKFLKILKMIYETLKPEYGWGDFDVNMESRGFDYMDVTKPILIYGKEIVEKIGRDRIATVPVQKKVRLSDEGYILLTENIGHYTPEIRDKIGKHLFGKEWNIDLIIDRNKKLSKNENK